MLYKNGINLKETLLDFIDHSEDLYILSAYIKLDALKYLIEGRENIKSICVRWEPRDLIVGVSDLEIYPYLKGKGISLYRNPRLHLKAFIDSFRRSFIGSANISNRALAISAAQNSNYEIATIVNNMTLDDRLFFFSIEQDSILITDDIYFQIKAQLPLKKTDFPEENDFELTLHQPDKHFLISSLPLSYDLDMLIRVYTNSTGVDEVEVNCAMHDLALYNMPLGLEQEDLIGSLKIKFFDHPFIKAFLVKLEENNEIYFGSAKDWIHKNCTDVPLPRKWDITKNIQILYRWFVDLGDGKYQIDVPGSYSERLSIVNDG